MKAKKTIKQIVVRIVSFFSFNFFKLVYSRKIKIGKNFTGNFKINLKGPGKIIIGNNVNLWAHAENNCFFTYSRNARIYIGDNSRINGSSFHAMKLIKVGENNLFGSVILMDHDFHNVYAKERIRSKSRESKPILTKNNVWLCGQSVVLKGVRIGENSVLGFRSVARKDIPKNSVWIGNPAKEVKKINYLE